MQHNMVALTESVHLPATLNQWMCLGLILGFHHLLRAKCLTIYLGRAIYLD